MNSKLLFLLECEMKVCEYNIKVAKKKLEKLPEGRLRISKHRSKNIFYHCTDNHNGKYIKVGEMNLAEGLANREKYTIILERCQKFLIKAKELEKILKECDWREYSEALHPVKCELCDDVILSDDEFAEKWLLDVALAPCDDNHKILTKKGDYVRSKSEKNIADVLFEKNIPYKYESTLYIDGNTYIPDFAILDKRTRKVTFWEHFGKIDDESYSISTIHKIDEYAREGVMLYENLVCTFETKYFQFPVELLSKYLDEKFA